MSATNQSTDDGTPAAPSGTSTAGAVPTSERGWRAELTNHLYYLKMFLIVSLPSTKDKRFLTDRDRQIRTSMCRRNLPLNIQKAWTDALDFVAFCTIAPRLEHPDRR